MFGPYWLYQLPLGVLFCLFLVLLLVPMEAGFRLGARRASSQENIESGAQADVTLASMMALLGLMLAFTYSFSLGRADLRKSALIDEVNAISTAFLRADRLPEPGRTEVRVSLFNYAKSRYIEPGTVTTLEEVKNVVDHSVKLQSKIWPTIKAALRENGEITDPEKALLVSAINDVLDAHTRRMAVFFDRLPFAVLALLVLIAGLSLAMASFSFGLRGRFPRWRMTGFALILASLMYTILDYDMMLRGFIRVDHSNLALLVEEMHAALQR